MNSDNGSPNGFLRRKWNLLFVCFLHMKYIILQNFSFLKIILILNNMSEPTLSKAKWLGNQFHLFTIFTLQFNSWFSLWKQFHIQVDRRNLAAGRHHRLLLVFWLFVCTYNRLGPSFLLDFYFFVWFSKVCIWSSQ